MKYLTESQSLYKVRLEYSRISPVSEWEERFPQISKNQLNSSLTQRGNKNTNFSPFTMVYSIVLVS